MVRLSSTRRRALLVTAGLVALGVPVVVELVRGQDRFAGSQYLVVYVVAFLLGIGLAALAFTRWRIWGAWTGLALMAANILVLWLFWCLPGQLLLLLACLRTPPIDGPRPPT